MTIKYLYIADHLELCGGAEINDAVLLSFLDCAVTKIRCADCTVQKLEALKAYSVIVSNFVGLSPQCKDYIVHNMNYVLIEHDHKYIKSRNPSIYKDFIAPPDQIINYEFYKNAKTVVCQTDKHTTVVKNNLKLNNIRNFSGNLWTKEQLDYLYNISKDRTVTEELYAILDSDIIHKGTQQSINWCKKNNKKYKLLPLQEWNDFIKDLSTCSHLCFFPGVLETCSRMAVEARMLGLTITGNHLISALYEPWFKENKGVALIDYFRGKNKTIKQFIDDCFTQKWQVLNPTEQIVGDYTVILNLYKRSKNLKAQIDAYKNQSIPPKEIWVWHNSDGSVTDANTDSTNASILWEDLGIDRWCISNTNWKYTGRFAMAQLATTSMLCIADDDSLPGVDWMKNCLSILQNENVLLGGVGVILNKDKTYSSPHTRVGWPHPEIHDIREADLVGHSWVFRKEILKHFWAEEPFTWDTGEDIHFSAMLQKAGIKTLVPAQEAPDRSSSILGYELGIDAVASSHVNNHSQFYALRDAAVAHYVKNGWKTINGG